MDIEVRQLEAQRVAYIRHYGPYGLEPTVQTLNRLLRWATSRKLMERGRVLGIPWDNPHFTPPEECCYDACITVPLDFQVTHPIIELQSLPAGTYLVRRCRSENGDLETPWQEFLAWYQETDWELTDAPCFEVYLNGCHQDPSGNWELELHMPVHPRSDSQPGP